MRIHPPACRRSPRIRASATTIALLLLTSCASVPMAPPEQDAASKQFPTPPADRAGLYVYRSSTVFGAALKKTVWLDGVEIGQTARGVFFHRLIPPGPHVLSTESEFSPNKLEFTAIAGKNHFFRQYIKMGAFVGGANLEAVSEEDGKAAVRDCGEALGTRHDTTDVRPGVTPPAPEKPARSPSSISSIPDGE